MKLEIQNVYWPDLNSIFQLAGVGRNDRGSCFSHSGRVFCQFHSFSVDQNRSRPWIHWDKEDELDQPWSGAAIIFVILTTKLTDTTWLKRVPCYDLVPSKKEFVNAISLIWDHLGGRMYKGLEQSALLGRRKIPYRWIFDKFSARKEFSFANNH
jgi:hypothetical protein